MVNYNVSLNQAMGAIAPTPETQITTFRNDMLTCTDKDYAEDEDVWYVVFQDETGSVRITLPVPPTESEDYEVGQTRSLLAELTRGIV